ncbi:MAG: hypothetical protein DRO23_01195 [Thermoprotei archaeon]|nr:MAG: hypothetical protein DRO23_01195 [Thermoprotei archaeon]
MVAPLCSICRKNQAMYVCQNCGRVICSNCFEPSVWLCVDCLRRKANIGPQLAVPEIPLLIKPLWIGIILTFAGFALMMLATLTVGLASEEAYIILPGLIIPLSSEVAFAVITCFFIIVIAIMVLFILKFMK